MTGKTTLNLYSAAQMRDAERRAGTEYGITLSALMENAGKCLAWEVLNMRPEGRVAVFCGKGNNGGDGYVCAAALMRCNIPVTVWSIGRDALTRDSLAGAAADAFEAAGGANLPLSTDISHIPANYCLIVDALFGTGLGRPLDGLYAYAVNLINAASFPVLSCDLPSGVEADTGQIMGTAVRASRTLMLGLAKQACALSPGDTYFGELLLGDIGLPQELTAAYEPAGTKSV